MQQNSRSVSSNQSGLHPNLVQVVQKHLTTRYREPLRAHNARAYDTLCQALADSGKRLVLDSFCGTGHSTATLAAHHPDCLVVGIDQSDRRLARHPAKHTSNYLLLRANCEPIWSQLVRDGITLAAHYLLYPNPWPKKSQLKRRIHGHPGFGDLVRLGGSLELRSNWLLFVEEFDAALQVAGVSGDVAMLPEQSEPITLFERKYRDSGHALWRYQGALPP